MSLKENFFSDTSFFKRKHFSFILLYVLLLFSGFSIYKDYGLSWDEHTSRVGNGLINYDYITKKNYDALINGNEKYHGPAFELVLIGLEKLLKLDDSQDIYFMRHLVTFLCFCIGVLFFYLICLRFYKREFLAFTAALFLILSPRIFAESFYNSKDLAFLSLFIVNIYTALVFAEKKNFRSALMHGLITGFTIDIRLPGIIIPAITLFFSCIDFILSTEIQTKKIRIAGNTLLYLLFTACFVVLFWPVLWKAPLNHLADAFHEMSKYPWEGKVLFMGSYIPAPHLPWYYIPVWLIITTPVLYIFLFITGIIFVTKSIIQNRLKSFTEFKYHFLILYGFFAPLLMVILLHSVVYDSWRHLYFIYPSFLLIAVAGLQKVFDWLQKKTVLRVVIYLVLFAGVSKTLYDMIRLHPFQYVYFNSLAGKNMNEVKKKFEMDYWGLSYKEGLNYIARHDTSEYIRIYTVNSPDQINLNLLPVHDRNRFGTTSTIEEADYFLGNFRWHTDDYPVGEEVYSARAGDAKIMTVYKLKSINSFIEKCKNNSKASIYEFHNDFESSKPGWSESTVMNVEGNAHSGTRVDALKKETEYSCSLTLHVPGESLDHRVDLLEVTVWMNAAKNNSMIHLVVESRNPDSYTYFWHSDKLANKANRVWEKKKFTVVLSRFESLKDEIRMYLWNQEGEEVSVDDWEVRWISAPGDLSHEKFRIN